MDTKISLSNLKRYDYNKNLREDSKINNLLIKNKAEKIANFFKMRRDGKIYGVKFAYTAAGVLVTTGTKYGANENLVVNPSTRTVIGRNDYANINLFKHIDANASYDANGNISIDYIKGEPGFSYTGKVDVVCVFAPVYERIYYGNENGTDYMYIEWTDTPRDGFTLNILCKDRNGDNQGFYTITKFQAGLIDNNPYCSANLYPWVNSPATGPSHNTCITKYHSRSQYMSAMTMGQMGMIERIFMMKYASTNYENKLNGLTSYYLTGYKLQASLTNKNYIVLLTTNANNLTVNTRIDIGTSSSRGSTSRNIYDNINITGKDSNYILFNDVYTTFTDSSDNPISISTECPISILIHKDNFTSNTSIDIDGESSYFTVSYSLDGENYLNGSIVPTMNSTNYVLELLDENSNHVGYSANGLSTVTVVYTKETVTTLSTHYAETAIYRSGYSLEILGDDGCYMIGNFATSQRFPSVISGIEFLTGAYDVIGNAVFNYDSSTNLHVYLQNDLTALGTSATIFTGTYTHIGYCTHTSAGSSWKYGKNIHYDLTNGGFTIDCDGGSSTTTGLCDAVFYLGNQTSGWYEVLAFGRLGSGAPDGPFCLSADCGLSYVGWSVASRCALACSPVLVV